MTSTAPEDQPQPPVEQHAEPDHDGPSDDDVAGHLFTGALREQDRI